MAISASDQAALDAMGADLAGSSNIPWSTLLGQVTLGTPTAGQLTLPAQEAQGSVFGLPTTTEQQLAGATLQGGPTVSEQELMGQGPVTYTVPGFGNMTAAQANALPDEQKNAILRQWSSVVSPNTPWPFGTLSGGALNTALSKALSEIGSGAYQGYSSSQSPTMAMQELGGFLANGAPTLGEQQLQAEQGQKTLALLASLRGPANAFTQQAVLHGLDSTGLSKAIGNIQGKYGLPTFSAPNANPQAASLQSLMDQVNGIGGGTGAGSNWTGAPGSTLAAPSPTPGQAQSGAIQASGPIPDGGSTVNPADGGTTVFGGTHIHVNGAGGASTLDPTTAAYVNSLPAPNKINGPNFENLDSNTKQFLLGAYQAAGYDPSDVVNQVTAGMPQFKAPSLGSVGASGQLVG